MKKITLTILVVFLVILSAFLFTGCKPEEDERILTTVEIATGESTELEFIYATDIHVMEASTEINDYQHPAFMEREFNCQKMNFISEAIFQTFCDDVIASGQKIVLIAGDLTERGTVISHTKVVECLDRMKQHGIKTYVVPGNHDLYTEGAKAYKYTSSGPVLIPKITEAGFAELYADYGYGPNSTRYGTTLSYATDINSKYTLIGVDNISRVLSKGHIDWIAGQAEAAFFAGKTPILMMHKPLGERFTGLYEVFGTSLSGSDEYTADAKSFAYMKKTLAEAGLTYILTGHVHSNDIMLVPSGYKPGGLEKSFVDIMGNCTSFYDSTYREIRFTKNYVDFSLKHISVPKIAHLPSYLTQEDLNQITTNWREFSLEFNKRDFIENLDSTLQSIPGIFSQFALGISLNDPTLTPEEKAEIAAYGKTVLLDYVLEVPIYEKDMSESDNISVESLAKKYGFTGTFPETEYKNIFDIITTIISKGVCAGEAEYVKGAPELELVKYGLYGLIANLAENDFFDNVAGFAEGIVVEDATEVISRLYTEGVFDLLDANILDNLLKLGIFSGADPNKGQLEQILKGLAGMSAEDVLPAILVLLPAINAFLKTDLLQFLPLDPLITKDTLTGEFNLGAFIEDYLYTTISKGVLYDPYTPHTQDFVILRSDLSTYAK